MFFVNPLASRLFKGVLFITLGVPVIAVLILLGLTLLGFRREVFSPLLFIDYVFFMPVHLVLGDNFIPVEEFGPMPGIKGFVTAGILYGGGSYFLANVIGFFVGRKKRA